MGNLQCGMRSLRWKGNRDIHTYTVYRWPLRHLKKVIRILRFLLTDNPPSPGKVGPTTGLYVPYSFRTVVWVLYVPHKNQITESAVRWDLRFLVLILEDQKVYLFVDVILKADLSSQLFEDPECWSTRGLNARPPAQQTAILPTELTRRRYPRDKSLFR